MFDPKTPEHIRAWIRSSHPPAPKASRVAWYFMYASIWLGSHRGQKDVIGLSNYTHHEESFRDIYDAFPEEPSLSIDPQATRLCLRNSFSQLPVVAGGSTVHLPEKIVHDIYDGVTVELPVLYEELGALEEAASIEFLRREMCDERAAVRSLSMTRTMDLVDYTQRLRLLLQAVLGSDSSLVGIVSAEIRHRHGFPVSAQNYLRELIEESTRV